MVALKKYARIEATGLWSADASAQRREVVVVLGDATLTIKATNDTALAHWSIAAIERQNPGKFPAIFNPDGDPTERLELSEDESEMVTAIDTVRLAVERARPRPGRLRWLGFAASAAAVLYVGMFWLPGALLDHTLGVVPDVGRKDIGQSLFTRIQRVTGPACGTSANTSSLQRLGARVGAANLSVMRGGIQTVMHLPGGRILLARQLVEDHEEPDVAAGYILAARHIAASRDPLRDLLDHAGTITTFRLLTTGRIDPDALDAYAEHLMTRPAPTADPAALISLFEQAEIRSAPYAYAQDITGETVLPLIEGDPLRGKPLTPVITDADWLRVQSICSS